MFTGNRVCKPIQKTLREYLYKLEFFSENIEQLYCFFFFSINSKISPVAEAGSRLPCSQGHVSEYNNRARVLTWGRQTIRSSSETPVEVPSEVSLDRTPMLLGRFRRKNTVKNTTSRMLRNSQTTDHGFYRQIIRTSIGVWLERFRRLNSIVFSSLGDKCTDVFV